MGNGRVVVVVQEGCKVEVCSAVYIRDSSRQQASPVSQKVVVLPNPDSVGGSEPRNGRCQARTWASSGETVNWVGWPGVYRCVVEG